ncbi:DUF6985 domain-containing protein [Clostridium uliginosum]|uniref:DUF6985 domain-containing protein n=1 Tax=Clostridium uliginosum TaxID=119641 RepID=A0A1I1NQ34_9CLOT|nr:hypothetical protein [Clostridium uliginosum]SFC99637.1 hypothetical protein SAMN05421842_11634 [Clostridium uliginosum]
MSSINDEALGLLTYNRGWTKEDVLKWWGHDMRLKIVVSAYENESVNVNQRQGYLSFKENLLNISDISLKKTKEYIQEMKNEVLPYINFDEIPDDILKIVKPSSILILESGSIGVLCDCSWDMEHGMAILISDKQKIDVGPQDILLE